jgi:hypothetical protein
MHFVYHPDHEAKIVSDEDYESHLDNGWFDTPAKFPLKEVVATTDLNEQLAQKEKELEDMKADSKPDKKKK